VKSLLDALNKPWPWNSHYLTGAGAALIVAQLWNVGFAGLVWLGINGAWLTAVGLRYRAQRKARRT